MVATTIPRFGTIRDGSNDNPQVWYIRSGSWAHHEFYTTNMNVSKPRQYQRYHIKLYRI